ncbi:MAG: DUF1799 domain-containing protein [Corticimicrobacter sp.]|uniref:DUF1799 domain-containing protein n=1 Tax=Corticimicrobacter sp. TaxID=2678536 RepID=UPI0032DBEE38
MEDFEGDTAFEVWPESWPAIDLYMRNWTQWRHGPGGASGLDYMVFFSDLDRQGVVGEDAEIIMADIRLIEEGALKAIYSRQ